MTGRAEVEFDRILWYCLDRTVRIVKYGFRG
jgi:hypothetical protein